MSHPHLRRVAITATGIVSPLGNNRAEVLRALREGRDCVEPVTDFDVSQCRSKTAARVKDLPRPKSRAGERLHPASLMMIEALAELRRTDREFSPEMMIIGTTSGGMSFGQEFLRSLLGANSRRRYPAWLANYGPQKPVLDSQEANGFRVPIQIIANACASGTNAIGHAFELIRAGRLQRVLCGGYDVISEMVYVGFDALQAATPEKCRPFDKDRSGLALGEGAAVLALEEFESARRRGAPVVGEVTGYGISTDNFHLTQPHPSGVGPLQAMERALQSGGCGPESVDYINAHGTATTFNDATEGLAIAKLFGIRVPVSSTKSMMGHALGAAGAIEAVISLLALEHGFLPPNIHFREGDPACELQIVANAARPAHLRRVVSNSFGFGGTNASIVLERIS